MRRSSIPAPEPPGEHARKPSRTATLDDPSDEVRLCRLQSLCSFRQDAAAAIPGGSVLTSLPQSDVQLAAAETLWRLTEEREPALTIARGVGAARTGPAAEARPW